MKDESEREEGALPHRRGPRTRYCAPGGRSSRQGAAGNGCPRNGHDKAGISTTRRPEGEPERQDAKAHRRKHGQAPGSPVRVTRTQTKKGPEKSGLFVYLKLSATDPHEKRFAVQRLYHGTGLTCSDLPIWTQASFQAIRPSAL